MKFSGALVFLALILAATGFQDLRAQEVKILKILDANLFETESGELIKLAGVDIPGLNHPNPYLRREAGEAVTYERSVFLNKRIALVRVKKDSLYNYVIMKKIYPLGETDYNEQFLENGMGRFTGEADIIHYDTYKAAEAKARDNNRGIWMILPADHSGNLDRKYSKDEYMKVDSIYTAQYRKNKANELLHPAAIMAYEALAGPAMGIAGGFISGLAIASANSNHGFETIGSFILGAGFGYITGTALGVYLVALRNNEDVSFWGTLGFSFLGTAAGIGLAAIPKDHEHPGYAVAGLFMPLAGSMIYTNLIDNTPSYNLPEADMRDLSFNRSYSHKDLYNSSMLYSVNILRINF